MRGVLLYPLKNKQTLECVEYILNSVTEDVIIS